MNDILSIILFPGYHYNSGSIMVCHLIGKEAINAHRFIKEVLRNYVVSFVPFISDNFVIMHENVKPHITTIVTECLVDLQLVTLPHPP